MPWLRFKLAADHLIAAIEDETSTDPEAKIKIHMGMELYLKVKAFSRFNKFFAVFAVLFSLAVIAWPALTIFSLAGDFSENQAVVVQSVFTALAALCVAAHLNYKKRQTEVEQLLRLTAFSGKKTSELVTTINSTMASDLGFSPKIPPS